jgi:hypothetical protein
VLLGRLGYPAEQFALASVFSRLTRSKVGAEHHPFLGSAYPDYTGDFADCKSKETRVLAIANHR